MKRFYLASAVVVAISGVVGGVAAGSPPADEGMGFGAHPMMGRPGMHGGHHVWMAGAMISRYDANNDGLITRTEVDAGLTKDFKAADTDHNGKVSSAEFKASMEARHAEMKAKMGKPEGASNSTDDDKRGQHGHIIHKAMMDPVKRLDWNRDGALSLDEMSAPVRLMAMRLDKDGNGTISATDLLSRGGPRMGDH